MTNNSPSKKAGLWESTIATAVRDMQWLHRRDLLQAPDAALSMKGLAETALGDSFVCAGDRLFLFELKAKASGKKTEWATGAEKLAFLSLKKALDGYSSAEEDFRAKTLRMLWASIKAHHFVYWADDPRTRGARRDGNLVFSSYLLDVAAHVCKQGDAAGLFAKQVLSHFSLGTVSTATQMVRTAEQLSLDRSFVGEAFGVWVDTESGGTVAKSVEAVGLELEAMQEYVNWLVDFQPEKDLAINGLLCSRDGTYIRQVSHISEICELLDKINTKSCKSLAEASRVRRCEIFGATLRISANPRHTSPSGHGRGRK